MSGSDLTEQEHICKRCDIVFIVPEGKSYKNCEPCRNHLAEQKRNRPKYDSKIYRLCKNCKQVKGINSDFTMNIIKTSNMCLHCRDQPKVPKDPGIINLSRLLGSVTTSLNRIMEEDEVREVMEHIEQFLPEEEEVV